VVGAGTPVGEVLAWFKLEPAGRPELGVAVGVLVRVMTVLVGRLAGEAEAEALGRVAARSGTLEAKAALITAAKRRKCRPALVFKNIFIIIATIRPHSIAGFDRNLKSICEGPARRTRFGERGIFLFHYGWGLPSFSATHGQHPFGRQLFGHHRKGTARLETDR